MKEKKRVAFFPDDLFYDNFEAVAHHLDRHSVDSKFFQVNHVAKTHSYDGEYSQTV